VAKRAVRRPDDLAPIVAAPPGLEVRHLRAFVALADLGRLTVAAEALGLAQSTASEALASLERAVGARLMIRGRGSRGLHLTAAGRTLLPHARRILAAVDAANAAMASATSRVPAALAIVANESISSYVLPEILPRLRRRWPATRFTVSVAACAGVRDGVGSGRFDLGLLLEQGVRPGGRRGSPQSARESERRVVLTDVPLVLFAAAGHPLASRRRSGWVGQSALAELPLFISDAAGDFHRLVRRFFKARGPDGPSIEATGSVEGVKKAVLADTRAIGLLPAYAVADELRAGTLVPVPLRPAPPRMRLEALLSTERPRHPSMEELLSAIGA
jgi:DNA-binding transcriptional LysR family regulator